MNCAVKPTMESMDLSFYKSPMAENAMGFGS